MILLGIETSCDETSASIVENGRKILANIVMSQEKIHSKYFGVVPELASRAHLEKINWVIDKALAESKIKKVDAVAYTYGPGLLGSLLVGQIAAQTVGYIQDIPIIPVNHIEGHILSVLLDNPSLSVPFLCLVVSGGHTELVIVKKIGQYKVLGRTRDDACGEAFDKVAKLLNLGYPGGPKVEKIARSGNSTKIKFPRPYMWETHDFSFSGIKTAVLYYIKKYFPGTKPINKTDCADISASFQEAIIDTLVNKTIKCAEEFKFKKIAVVGGVSSNKKLRQRFHRSAKSHKRMKVFFPSMKLSTDNAAMIATAGHYKFQREIKNNKNFKIEFNGYNLKVDPDLSL